MCILPPVTGTVSSPTPAQRLPPEARRQLAVDSLSGQAITKLASQHQVSRKFVYQQRQRADEGKEGIKEKKKGEKGPSYICAPSERKCMMAPFRVSSSIGGFPLLVAI